MKMKLKMELKKEKGKGPSARPVSRSELEIKRADNPLLIQAV
jgi:hypothetical protein